MSIVIDFAMPPPEVIDAIAAALHDYEEDRTDQWIAALDPAERARVQAELAKLPRQTWSQIDATATGAAMRERARATCKAIAELALKGGAV